MQGSNENEARPHLSVVIPAFNEEEVIQPCLVELEEVLAGDGIREYEVIVVDDGSTDATFDLLRDMRSRMPHLRLLRFSENNGQSAAFDAGFRAARGEVIVTMDADMQNDPRDIARLLGMTDEWDVVCGYRRERRDSVVRRLSSSIANSVRNRLTGENIRDVGCSMRAMRTDMLDGLVLYAGMHRFLPTLLRMNGATVTEVAVNHRPRELGTPKYGIGNRLFRAIRDLAAVRWMQARRLHYTISETIE